MGSYEVDGEVGGILFGSQKLIEYFIRAKQIFFDATFKITPKLFYQVLTIKFPFKGKTFPALVIVMKGKSREHYNAAFSKVKELFPEFNPTHGMADHEAAARASAQQIFDGLLVKSCWFYYWYVQKFFCFLYTWALTSRGHIKPFAFLFTARLSLKRLNPWDLISCSRRKNPLEIGSEN